MVKMLVQAGADIDYQDSKVSMGVGWCEVWCEVWCDNCVCVCVIGISEENRALLTGPNGNCIPSSLSPYDDV
jgi:hypothetical protein